MGRDLEDVAAGIEQLHGSHLGVQQLDRRAEHFVEPFRKAGRPPEVQTQFVESRQGGRRLSPHAVGFNQRRREREVPEH